MPRPRGEEVAPLLTGHTPAVHACARAQSTRRMTQFRFDAVSCGPLGRCQGAGARPAGKSYAGRHVLLVPRGGAARGGNSVHSPCRPGRGPAPPGRLRHVQGPDGIDPVRRRHRSPLLEHPHTPWGHSYPRIRVGGVGARAGWVRCGNSVSGCGAGRTKIPGMSGQTLSMCPRSARASRTGEWRAGASRPASPSRQHLRGRGVHRPEPRGTVHRRHSMSITTAVATPPATARTTVPVRCARHVAPADLWDKQVGLLMRDPLPTSPSTCRLPPPAAVRAPPTRCW
jgi:hypothetical protein